MAPPYPDNLYSNGGDSDAGDDALSPTDGYFHASSPGAASSSTHQPTSSNVPLVPNILVQDPSLPEGSKAREVEEERRLNTNAHSPPVSHIQALHQPLGAPTSSTQHYHRHQHRRSVEEDRAVHPGPATLSPLARNPPNLTSPLPPQHQVDAPPAYTPSPSSYQTFAPTMGLPEEHQRLLSRGPESMSGPPAGPARSRWQRFRDACSGTSLRRRIKTILGGLVILSILSILVSGFKLRSSHKMPNVHDEEPIKDPNMEHGDLEWQPSRGCLNKPYSLDTWSTTVDFQSSRKLTVIQEVEKNDHGASGRRPRVSGQLVLRPTAPGSPGKLEVEAIANDKSLELQVNINRETQELNVQTPRRVDWSSHDGTPCIQLRITVWAPQQTLLNALRLDLTHLDVEIMDGLALGVEESTSVRTTAGNVKTSTPRDDDHVLPYTLQSREIYIETASGKVEGWYPLYDILDIKTASGDVDTRIKPKPVSAEHPRPAQLHVHSISGHINVHEPVDHAVAADNPSREFPARDYLAKLGGASGDITATLAMSSLASFESQSGHLELRLWPVLDSRLSTATADTKPMLKTDTKSGTTRLEVLEPLWTSLKAGGSGAAARPGSHAGRAGPPALAVLESQHTSVSGSVRVVYPRSWEGRLSAESVSGSQRVRGHGLEVSPSGRPFVRRITAHKGNGDSDLSLHTVSGDEDVLIGQE